MRGSAGDVTTILRAVSDGDRGAVEALWPLVYAELRSRAAGLMGGERRDHTLQPTALVHEAYLKLVDQTRCQWRDRVHFFAIAARIMRRILTDHAKHNARLKRGGGRQRVCLEEAAELTSNGQPVDLVELDEALSNLEAVQPRWSRIVELRFYGGLDNNEAAEALGVTTRTVERQWKAARTWLYCALNGDS